MSMMVAKGVLSMHETPDKTSLLVSQAQYGQRVEILEKSGEWVHIQTPDGYKGWVKEKHLTESTDYSTEIKTSSLRSSIYSGSDASLRPVLTLGKGAPLQKIEDLDPRWIKVRLINGTIAYVQRGDVLESPKDLVAYARQLIGVSYLWGGTTTLEGMDCSGFVQHLFHEVLGITLPRDSKDQYVSPLLWKVSRENLQPGDLVFFGSLGVDKVTHVAMYIGEGQIIHSTVRDFKSAPGVKINLLDPSNWPPLCEYKGARRLVPTEEKAMLVS